MSAHTSSRQLPRLATPHVIIGRRGVAASQVEADARERKLREKELMIAHLQQRGKDKRHEEERLCAQYDAELAELERQEYELLVALEGHRVTLPATRRLTPAACCLPPPPAACHPPPATATCHPPPATHGLPPAPPPAPSPMPPHRSLSASACSPLALRTGGAARGVRQPRETARRGPSDVLAAFQLARWRGDAAAEWRHACDHGVRRTRDAS